jgi:hypothetical protein
MTQSRKDFPDRGILRLDADGLRIAAHPRRGQDRYRGDRQGAGKHSREMTKYE